MQHITVSHSWMWDFDSFLKNLPNYPTDPQPWYRSRTKDYAQHFYAKRKRHQRFKVQSQRQRKARRLHRKS